MRSDVSGATLTDCLRLALSPAAPGREAEEAAEWF
jgi:hypothetical protein